LVIEPFCKLEGIGLPEMPGRAYVGGLFGAGGPPADIGSVADVLCCSAQESDAVARVAAIIADASRGMIFFFTSISLGDLLSGNAVLPQGDR
jgi:hypothetical protein